MDGRAAPRPARPGRRRGRVHLQQPPRADYRRWLVSIVAKGRQPATRPHHHHPGGRSLEGLIAARRDSACATPRTGPPRRLAAPFPALLRPCAQASWRLRVERLLAELLLTATTTRSRSPGATVLALSGIVRTRGHHSTAALPRLPGLGVERAPIFRRGGAARSNRLFARLLYARRRPSGGRCSLAAAASPSWSGWNCRRRGRRGAIDELRSRIVLDSYNKRTPHPPPRRSPAPFNPAQGHARPARAQALAWAPCPLRDHRLLEPAPTTPARHHRRRAPPSTCANRLEVRESGVLWACRTRGCVAY